MSPNQVSDKSQHVFRVDKFIVPPDARETFTEKVRNTHKLLRTQPGFVQDFVFEQTRGAGEYNFVTVVEWEDMGAIEKAKKAVKAMHRETNFNPREMLPRLNIKAAVGCYDSLEIS